VTQKVAKENAEKLRSDAATPIVGSRALRYQRCFLDEVINARQVDAHFLRQIIR